MFRFHTESLWDSLCTATADHAHSCNLYVHRPHQGLCSKKVDFVLLQALNNNNESISNDIKSIDNDDKLLAFWFASEEQGEIF